MEKKSLDNSPEFTRPGGQNSKRNVGNLDSSNPFSVFTSEKPPPINFGAKVTESQDIHN